jgi:hypothetical protein
MNDFTIPTLLKYLQRKSPLGNFVVSTISSFNLTGESSMDIVRSMKIKFFPLLWTLLKTAVNAHSVAIGGEGTTLVL